MELHEQPDDASGDKSDGEHRGNSEPEYLISEEAESVFSAVALHHGHEAAAQAMDHAADTLINAGGSLDNTAIEKLAGDINLHPEQTKMLVEQGQGAHTKAVETAIGKPWVEYLGHIVPRHINWNNQRPDLKEVLAHLVQYIKRRFCGIASAGLPLFSVLSFPVVLK